MYTNTNPSKWHMLRYTGAHYGWCTMEGQAQRERGCGQTCVKYTNWTWERLPNMKGKARQPRRLFRNTPIQREKNAFMGFLPWVPPRFLPHILKDLLCNWYPGVRFKWCSPGLVKYGTVRYSPVRLAQDVSRAVREEPAPCLWESHWILSCATWSSFQATI